MNFKSPFQSTTIRGAVVMVVTFILSHFDLGGITSEPELTEIVTKTFEVINTIIFVVGAVMAIYGRFRARQPLSLSKEGRSQ